MKNIAVLLIGALILSSCQTQMDHSNMDMGAMKMAEMETNERDHTHLAGHDHAPIELDPNNPIPTLEISGHIDQVSGFNLKLETTNFELSGEKVNTRHEVGYGHAHVYINDEKFARVYSAWHYIPGDTLPDLSGYRLI